LGAGAGAVGAGF